MDPPLKDKLSVCVCESGFPSRYRASGTLTSTYITPSETSTSTLRASLSGTFLQTLPDLVTPLKGHLYPRAVHRRGQRPPKDCGTAQART